MLSCAYPQAARLRIFKLITFEGLLATEWETAAPVHVQCSCNVCFPVPPQLACAIEGMTTLVTFKRLLVRCVVARVTFDLSIGSATCHCGFPLPSHIAQLGEGESHLGDFSPLQCDTGDL